MQAISEFKQQPFETNRYYLLYTILISILAVFVHIWAQTAGFVSSYFEPPNFYNMPETARVDQVTHALSSHAMQCWVMNLNLPKGLRYKWIFALFIGIFFSVSWELAEYATISFWGWIQISNIDTLLDLIQDFIGAVAAVGLYYISTVWDYNRLYWRRNGFRFDHKQDSTNRFKGHYPLEYIGDIIAFKDDDD